jgi:hypothetical protein
MIDLSDSQTQHIIIETIGYLASLFVAISLFMTSILKLRWYIFIGNILFVIYGIFIHSYPVIILNLFNGAVNIFFIVQAYTLQGKYAIIPVEYKSPLIQRFLELYYTDIKHFFPQFENFTNEDIIFAIMKGSAIIGVTAFKKEDNKATVVIDYVAPSHRNMKPGKLLFQEEDIFNLLNVNAIFAKSYSKKHSPYLKKIGFELINPDQQIFKLKRASL